MAWPLVLSAFALFRSQPVSQVTPEAIAILHITDVHADPFYDVSLFGCGNKACTRNLTLQDAKGQPTLDLCSDSKRLVKGECGPEVGDYKHLAREWSALIHTGDLCPCGVAFSNPPYSVIPPLRRALLEFANDGYHSKTAIYTGDVAGHYMPGTSVPHCRTAQAVVFSSIAMLDVPGVEHFFVMGNNDVIPKGEPLTHEWLHEVGSFLLERNWLTRKEMSTWVDGGFFWRMIHHTGLCAVGLNSNHWTPTQVNHEMQSAQLEWLPGILSRQGETSVCTRGFLVVSHIGVVCPDVAIYPGCKHPAENDVNDEAMVAAGGMAGSSMDEDVSKQSKTDVHDRNGEGKYLSKSKKHGGHLPPVVNDELWGTDKSSTLHCMEIRKILDHYADAIVAEWAGDLNTEHIYAAGDVAATWGHTAVGVSARGGNDPGFKRVFMSADGKRTLDIESYQMKRGCTFSFGHSAVQDYAPHFDHGIDATSVRNMLRDGRMLQMREANSAPNAAGITKITLEDPKYIERVRAGMDGCLAEDVEEVPRFSQVGSQELSEGNDSTNGEIEGGVEDSAARVEDARAWAPSAEAQEMAPVEADVVSDGSIAVPTSDAVEQDANLPTTISGAGLGIQKKASEHLPTGRIHIPTTLVGDSESPGNAVGRPSLSPLRDTVNELQADIMLPANPLSTSDEGPGARAGAPQTDGLDNDGSKADGPSAKDASQPLRESPTPQQTWQMPRLGWLIFGGLTAFGLLAILRRSQLSPRDGAPKHYGECSELAHGQACACAAEGTHFSHEDALLPSHPKERTLWSMIANLAIGPSNGAASMWTEYHEEEQPRDYMRFDRAA